MSTEMEEGLSIAQVPEETRDALHQAAAAVMVSLIWDCRGMWPAGESEEVRREQIGHSARFVYDSLFKTLQVHASVVAAQLMAEKPAVPQ